MVEPTAQRGQVAGRPPKGLDVVGRQAWRRAYASVCSGYADPVRFLDAISRYARAVEDAAYLRREWVRGGRPVTARLNGDADGSVHPSLRALRDGEQLAARLGAALGLDLVAARRAAPARPRGRPVGASSAPDRPMGGPPKLKLAGGE